MKQYLEITPEDIELILWGDLKIMMESSTEENDQGDFWNNQQEWEIVRWRLYSFTKNVSDLGLEVEEESTDALHLNTRRGPIDTYSRRACGQYSTLGGLGQHHARQWDQSRGGDPKVIRGGNVLELAVAELQSLAYVAVHVVGSSTPSITYVPPAARQVHNLPHIPSSTLVVMAKRQAQLCAPMIPHIEIKDFSFRRQ
ncbi:hypothetical protein Tco_1201828 [Tanacetum coccineum]